MNIHSRPFQTEDDFWRIRSLAVETYAITGPGWNWDIRRWDGSRFYSANPVLPSQWNQTIRLWETSDGRLAGAANSDGPGLFYLQIHPDYRNQIEEEMIAWAEEALSAPMPGSTRCQVHIEAFEYDWPRQRLLEKRGFEKTGEWGVFRKMHLTNRPLPEVKMAAGYLLRTIRAADWEDCQRLADLLNAAFNRNFHNPGEFHNFARLAPSIRPELHFVAEAPDGSFAAHVAVIYDEINRRGLFEPVCTHPAHRRKGLAHSLMLEGLHRMKTLGAREATVETGDMGPANSLYDSVGFSEVYQNFVWQKIVNR